MEVESRVLHDGDGDGYGDGVRDGVGDVGDGEMGRLLNDAILLINDRRLAPDTMNAVN